MKYLENLASKINCHSKELSGETQNLIIEYYKQIKFNYKYEIRTENSLEELKQKIICEIRNISGYISSIGKSLLKITA